jgi:hypothetical protein
MRGGNVGNAVRYWLLLIEFCSENHSYPNTCGSFGHASEPRSRYLCLEVNHAFLHPLDTAQYPLALRRAV